MATAPPTWSRQTSTYTRSRCCTIAETGIWPVCDHLMRFRDAGGPDDSDGEPQADGDDEPGNSRGTPDDHPVYVASSDDQGHGRLRACSYIRKGSHGRNAARRADRRAAALFQREPDDQAELRLGGGLRDADA